MCGASGDRQDYLNYHHVAYVLAISVTSMDCRSALITSQRVT